MIEYELPKTQEEPELPQELQNLPPLIGTKGGKIGQKDFLGILDAGITTIEPQSVWTERTILPKPDRMNPYGGLVIEVIGLPEAGKSTLKEFLNTKFPKIKTVDEIENGAEPSLANISHSLHPAHTAALFAGIKIEQTTGAIENLIEQMEGFARSQIQKTLIPPGKHQIMYRGPNDVLCHRFVIPDFSTLPQSEKDFLVFKYIEDITTALAMATFVDAVCLLGLDSLETAQQRRILAGKEPTSKLVNELWWPAVSKGFNWWLTYIYPYLRKHYGTGLLVINGGNPLEQNKATVSEFIDTLAQLHETKRKQVINELP
jgi:hypothetical protein